MSADHGKVDPDIVRYIRRHLGTFTDEQIREGLLRDGVPPLAVEQGFREAKAEPPPAEPAPRKPFPWRKVLPLAGLAASFGACLAINRGIKYIQSPEFQSLLMGAQGRSAAGPEGQGSRSAGEAKDLQAKAGAFQTYANLAMRDLKLGRYAEAVRNADSALAEWSPEAAGEENRKIMIGLRAQAKELGGDPDGALADYGLLLRLDPKNAGAVLARCKIHLARKDYESVLAEADDLVALAPGEPAGHSLRAAAFASMGDAAGAIAAYGKAIAASEASAEARTHPERLANLFFNRGAMRVNSGKPKSGLGDISRAIELAPGEKAYLEARAGLYEALGERRKAAADRERARRAAAKAPEASPGAGDLSLGLGSTLPTVGQ